MAYPLPHNLLSNNGIDTVKVGKLAFIAKPASCPIRTHMAPGALRGRAV
jgi:hypothetical protein